MAINGYDKYLEFQYRQTGGFYTALFNAIMRADNKNMVKFASGFPSEVEAYRIWTSGGGAEEFIKHVTPGHALLEQFADEYDLELESLEDDRGQ